MVSGLILIGKMYIYCIIIKSAEIINYNLKDFDRNLFTKAFDFKEYKLIHCIYLSVCDHTGLESP